MAYRYILRYLVDPAFAPGERIAELVDFCRQSRIEEVMLLLTAEELSPGHPTPDEIAPWIAMARELRCRLAEAEIAMSLNPWTTIFHNQRGRRLRPGQDFRLMVGENGRQSSITVCPLCERWQEYLSALFARFASEIAPVALWIEDDWRLSNHDTALGWGGCFCDHHLALFSEQVGRRVERPELLESLLAPGTPHPWREAWLDLNGQTLLQPLRKVAASVRQANSAVRLGLMSSGPDVHSIEGRGWAAFQETLGAQPAFLTRPHMPPYTQTNALLVPPSRTLQTLANLSGPLEIYPELENSPRCGLYSKSSTFSQWEMLHAAALGSHGITINHYDMLGNGIALDPTLGEMLAQAKPRLDALADLGVEPRAPAGVRVLFSPGIARHVRTEAGASSVAALSHASTTWSEVFFILGIAHGFCAAETAGLESPGVTAVSGQTLRTLGDEAIERLLGGSLLLDAMSAAILVERGFGAEIGVTECRWRTLQATGYSYEEIDEADPRIYGVALPRLCAQRCHPRLLEMIAAPGCRVRSRIRDANHRSLWPGVLTFRNPRGGRIALLTYPVEPAAQFFMAFFNGFRREFIQRLIFELAPGAPWAATGCSPLNAYRHSTPEGLFLAALNPLDDTAPGMTWRLPPGSAAAESWRILAENGQWEPIRPDWRRGLLFDEFVFNRPLPALKGGFLLYSA